MATVRLYELVPVPWLINRKRLKTMVLEIFRLESQEIQDLNIILCDDKFLLGINREFLQHDDFTDIITFDLSDTVEVKGEIYISVPRVLDNAILHNVSRTEELHRVIFHGCLHLCGYKDKLKNDTSMMRQKEEEYLKHYASRSST